MKVLVTRPAAQAAEWVAQLGSRGIAAAALPLIDIVAPDDSTRAAQAAQAWRTLSEQALVVFVSPNAVEHFFAAGPAGAVWPDDVIAASPGPGTTQALLTRGLSRERIVAPAADAPQFDSEALWAQLSGRRDWAGAAVTIVRGDGGRHWLAETLQAEGATVDFVAAYRRVPPTLDENERSLLREASALPGEHLWFFSSSQALDHLVVLAPAMDWGAAQALATHPRIAERAHRVGFGSVQTCRPTLEAVAACIQSIAP